MEKVRVAFLAAEAAPYIKIGGLGDVAGSLPPALNNLSPVYSKGQGLDVRLFIPFHGEIRDKITAELIDDFSVASTSGSIPAQIFRHTANDNSILYLIAGAPIKSEYPVYTADNSVDGEKYTFFSVAALNFMERTKWKPDIFHANDWHTSPGVSLLSLLRRKKAFFKNSRTILTVHNLAYMGHGAESALKHYGIPENPITNLPSWARGLPLPLGLASADEVVTVSPTYAREILTPEFGCLLETFLATRQSSLSGILNGLDVACWDPESDHALARNFTWKCLSERDVNKLALLRHFGLNEDPKCPLIILVSRMDQQKGVDIVLDGLRKSFHLPWQIIMLGTGNPILERACRDFQAEYPSRVRVKLKFDSNLARQMYAGGDMLLVPSRYEPCGLVQMIGMRYGCIPVARATGGLQDTIINISDTGNATGFLFQNADGSALAHVMEQAIYIYNNNDADWKEMQIRGMRTDFSWEKSAIQYASTYIKLMEKPL